MEDIFYNKLKIVLSDIESYVRYGAVFYDFGKKNRPLTGAAFCKLCAVCVENNKTSESCLQNAQSASYQSWLRGRAYTFKCWLGLFGIIMPIAPDGKKITGAVEIGGLFPRGSFQSSLHQIVSTLDNLDPRGKLSRLVAAFQGTDEMSPMDFETCGEFLKEALCSSGLLDSSAVSLNAELWAQQNRISGRKEDMKSLSMDKEKLICFMALDLAKTKKNLKEKEILKKSDEFLSVVSLESGGNMELFKCFLLIAMSIIKMGEIRGELNNSSPSPLSSFSVELESFYLENDFKTLCLNFQKMLLRRSDARKSRLEKNDVSERVLSYLSKHFMKNIRLNDAASSAGASASTVMHRLKDDTGETFAHHLNAIRVKEAKRLLAYTGLNIGEISERCGFSEQGYFSKVFTKHISMTPREFRRMLALRNISK